MFITGASGGVGLSTAQEFISQGCNLTLHYNTQKTALAPFASLPQVHTVQADVVVESQVSNAIRSAVSKNGPIDVLIVCHGVWPTADIPVIDMPYARWKKTLNINLDGTFLFIKHYLQQLDTYKDRVDIPSIVLIGCFIN